MSTVCHPLLIFCLSLGLGHLWGLETIPYGSPDYYPSHERPIGFCGDGNSWFPGATPVRSFREGTVSPYAMTIEDKGKAVTIDSLDLTDSQSHNIVWKTPLPSWGNSHPIVVGDRIFTLAEPNTLVCCDAHTGRILWQREADPWRAAGIEDSQADQLVRLWELWRAVPFWQAMINKSTVYRPLLLKEWEQLLPIYEQKVMPRLLQELKTIAPGVDFQSAAQFDVDHIKQQVLPAVKNGKLGKALPRKRGFANKISAHMRSMSQSPMPRLRLPWGFEVGSMVAPVSDGERVYASFAHGSTICCDLNGTVLWQRYHHNDLRVPTQSPLLIDNTLVLMHVHTNELVALDKRSGKDLWTAPTKAKGMPKGIKHSNAYAVGNHFAMYLPGDDALAVIVTMQCNILRAKDGQVLGEIPWRSTTANPIAGPSLMSFGDIIIQMGEDRSLAGYRLRAQGSESVEVEPVFSGKTERFGCKHKTRTAGALIVGDHQGMHVVDGATGEPLFAADRRRTDLYAQLSNTVAGDVNFTAIGGKVFKHSIGLSAWKQRRTDGKALACFLSIDVANPAKPVLIEKHNVLGGADFPAMPAMQRYAPELYAASWYASSAWGKPCHRLHADNCVSALGNRLFIRTIGELYCIGDPAVRYNWNPASRPAAISKRLQGGE